MFWAVNCNCDKNLVFVLHVHTVYMSYKYKCEARVTTGATALHQSINQSTHWFPDILSTLNQSINRLTTISKSVSPWIVDIFRLWQVLWTILVDEESNGTVRWEGGGVNRAWVLGTGWTYMLCIYCCVCAIDYSLCRVKHGSAKMVFPMALCIPDLPKFQAHADDVAICGLVKSGGKKKDGLLHFNYLMLAEK